MARASRAKWVRSSYYRKTSKDYRNPYSGRISDSPIGGKTLGRERREEHSYGSDRLSSPNKRYNERKKRYERL